MREARPFRQHSTWKITFISQTLSINGVIVNYAIAISVALLSVFQRPVNNKGFDLRVASSSLDFSLTASLLKEGVLADATTGTGDPYTALYWLCFSGRRGQPQDRVEEMATLLLRHGAKPEPSSEYSLLCFSAENNAVGVTRALLRAGDDPNKPDPRLQRPPLYYALAVTASQIGYIQPERPIVVKLLLEHKADPNIVATRYGGYPLHIAAFEGYLESSKLLIEHGAKINARAPKAIINDRDRSLNYTALHCAALRNTPHHAQVVRYLLSKGANRRIKDKLGRTAEELARKKKHDLIVAAFRER